MSLHEQVSEFNGVYGVPMVGDIEGVDYAAYRLVYRLLTEELQEVSQAYVAQDPVNYVKELADVIYVAAQQMHRLGVNVDEVMAAVHESNMSKLSETGAVIMDEQGKVLKGPNYFKAEPKIAELLAA